MSDTLARLLRACATGYGRRSAISPKGLANLTRQKLWREAAEAIIRLETVHPRSQDCFMEAWMGTSFGFHLDEDLAVPFLRKVLRPYVGYDAILFRGQPSGPVGLSWTTSPYVALMYALFGFENPIEAECRVDGVILSAIVPYTNIISAPGLHGRGVHGRTVGEHVIDPRGFEFSTEPALEASVWICEHMASVLGRVNNPASLESLWNIRCQTF